MKRITNSGDYVNVLPYASEVFGVYQPLLGWRSKQIKERIERGFALDLAAISKAVLGKFVGDFTVNFSDRGIPEIAELHPGALAASRTRTTGTFITDAIVRNLPPLERYNDSVWDVIEPARMQSLLTEAAMPAIAKWATSADGATVAQRSQNSNLVMHQLQRESTIAGFLLHLKQSNQIDLLKKLFYKPELDIGKFLNIQKFRDPLDYFDPFRDIDRVGLSPIGIVHLFRQYFYEFDTFLGPPVGHVWLSPGSTVELMEVNTRRTLIERALETELETTLRTEKSTTDEDEISNAVKQDNKSDAKFGMNATTNQGWIGGSATASSSINIDTTQAKACEQTHQHMRQQSEKLSTEIRKNYKSTFRTVTETTDTSSKRYVLANSTDKLINYELRRKMRQVGIQIQDIGTYLCWQTYVDDPGRQLGVAKMVHIANDPEMGNEPAPE